MAFVVEFGVFRVVSFFFGILLQWSDFVSIVGERQLFLACQTAI